MGSLPAIHRKKLVATWRPRSEDEAKGDIELLDLWKQRGTDPEIVEIRNICKWGFRACCEKGRWLSGECPPAGSNLETGQEDIHDIKIYVYYISVTILVQVGWGGGAQQ
jgi:hypothetical protein